MEKTFHLENISEIVSTAWDHITHHSSSEHATVVCLHGDLGSGKTTFTKHLAQYLGVTSPIQSPTFVILKNYSLSGDHRFKNLIHIDAYRLNHEADLERLNWSDYYNKPENIIIIEWSSIVPGIIPAEHIDISLSHVDETTRHIHI